RATPHARTPPHTLSLHDALPISWFMFTDTILVFDHVKHSIKVVAHVRLDGDIDSSYRIAQRRIDEIVERLERPLGALPYVPFSRSEEHTSELQSRENLVCRLLLE